MKKGSSNSGGWGKQIGGDDVPKFEPKTWLKFKDIDKSIQELRAIYKAHPQWFDVPKPGSDKGKNLVEYSIEIEANNQFNTP